MKVRVEDIIIKERVRTDIGDLKPLMKSMQEHGQLNPVTLSRENELIAGHRRTLAAKELGWVYVDATIVDHTSEVEKLQLELEENVHRKDFCPEELLAGYRKLDRLMHPSVGRRIGQAISKFFRRLFSRKAKKQNTTHDDQSITLPQEQENHTEKKSPPPVATDDGQNFGV